MTEQTDLTIQPQDLPAVQNIDRPMTVNEVLIQTQIVHNILEHCMADGVHYGKIPGTEKRTLLQPGAEKICATFRLAPKYDVEDLSEPHNNYYRYRVRCNLFTIRDGLFVGSAVGECSSLEEKYQWEEAINDKHFESTDPSNRRIKFKAKRDDRGKKMQNEALEIKQVRTNAADLANTVLKIGVKRSLISAARGSVAASDLLDVDLDEETIKNLHLDEQEVEQPAGKLKAKARPAPTLPFGPSQGKAINDPEVPDQDLMDMLRRKQEELKDPNQKSWHARIRSLVEALQAELKHRGSKAAQETKQEKKTDPQPKAQPKSEPKEHPSIPDSQWTDLKVFWEEECRNSLGAVLDDVGLESIANVPPSRRAEFRDLMNDRIKEAKKAL